VWHHPCVAGIGEASLAAVVHALDERGYRPQVRALPGHGPTCAAGQGAWIAVPDATGFVVVAVDDVMPCDRTGGWREAFGRTAPAAVTGYRVSFHERSSGHSYGRSGTASFHTVFLDEVVAQVRDWVDWESTWSVTPLGEDTARRTARLRRLAASRRGSAAIPVDLDVDPLMLALLSGVQAETVSGLLAELFLPGIRWRFPRDRTGGRLANRAQVLLHECAPPTHPAGKGIWLVVEGPLPRAEQRLAVRLARVVGKSAPHRWNDVPEYWHTGPRGLDQLWGAGGSVSIAAAVDNLLGGRPLDALAMCGVTVDRGARRLLSGQPVRFALREWTDKWVTNATNLIAGSAPWLWSSTAKPRQRPRRLEGLGGPSASSRPGLFLAHRDGQPHLSFDQNGSPLVVPKASWQRDVDYDLVRLGLLQRDQIPLPRPQGTARRLR
jgi:hypothetical protein